VFLVSGHGLVVVVVVEILIVIGHMLSCHMAKKLS
jgi:hypothetical protein